MGIQVRTEFKDADVQDFFKNLKKKLGRIENGEKKYSGLISAVVFQEVNKHFDDEQGSKGPWAKWSPSYRKQLEKIGRAGNKILQFDRRMRQTFKPTNVKSTKQGIVWFNNAQTKSGFPYAYAHDTGGPTLPQRDFMWLSPQGLDKIGVLTLQFMLDEGV